MDYEYTTDWFSQNVPTSQQIIKGQPLHLKKVLEIGSFESRASTWIIENIVAPNQGHLFCLDTWQGGVEHDKSKMGDVEARFGRNMQRALRERPGAEMTKSKGKSSEMMARLIADGHVGSFDFIYVDGSHLASDVLCDLTLAFTLSKVGGLIACDDYMYNFGDDPRRTPKLAVDAFANCYSGRVRVILAWLYQFYMLKVAE